jgi:hypothetical protein
MDLISEEGVLQMLMWAFEKVIFQTFGIFLGVRRLWWCKNLDRGDCERGMLIPAISIIL